MELIGALIIGFCAGWLLRTAWQQTLDVPNNVCHDYYCTRRRV